MRMKAQRLAATAQVSTIECVTPSCRFQANWKSRKGESPARIAKLRSWKMRVAARYRKATVSVSSPYLMRRKLGSVGPRQLLYRPEQPFVERRWVRHIAE